VREAIDLWSKKRPIGRAIEWGRGRGSANEIATGGWGGGAHHGADRWAPTAYVLERTGPAKLTRWSKFIVRARCRFYRLTRAYARVQSQGPAGRPFCLSVYSGRSRARPSRWRACKLLYMVDRPRWYKCTVSTRTYLRYLDHLDGRRTSFHDEEGIKGVSTLVAQGPRARHMRVVNLTPRRSSPPARL
jgi:hypothetical protein